MKVTPEAVRTAIARRADGKFNDEDAKVTDAIGDAIANDPSFVNFCEEFKSFSLRNGSTTLEMISSAIRAGIELGAEIGEANG